MSAKQLRVAKEYSDREDIRALLISLNLIPEKYGEIAKLESLTLEIRSGYISFGLSDDHVEMGILQPEGSLQVGSVKFIIKDVPVLPNGVYIFHNLTVTFVNENITLVEFNNRESYWNYVRELADLLG